MLCFLSVSSVYTTFAETLGKGRRTQKARNTTDDGADQEGQERESCCYNGLILSHGLPF